MLSSSILRGARFSASTRLRIAPFERLQRTGEWSVMSFHVRRPPCRVTICWRVLRSRFRNRILFHLIFLPSAQIDPETQTELMSVEVPVLCPTSLVFGGKDLSELYVTTGGLGEEKKGGSSEHRGGLFRALIPGVKGVSYSRAFSQCIDAYCSSQRWWILNRSSIR